MNGFLLLFLLFANVAGALFIVRGVFMYRGALKAAGDKKIHVFPKRGIVVGSFSVNALGLVFTWITYFLQPSTLMLALSVVFILNTYTMISRLTSVHAKGIVTYGKFHDFSDMKKLKWGEQKKRHKEMTIRFGDKARADIFVNVPNELVKEVGKELKLFMKK